MLFRCSFFRTQQLGSGPADIPRILVFHCSHCDVVTNTVLGQFKKRRKQHIVNTQNKKQKLKRTKFHKHTQSFMCLQKTSILQTHALCIIFCGCVRTPRKFSSRKEKEQNPVNETLYNVPPFAGNYDTVHYYIFFFFGKKFLDSLLLRSTKWFLSPIVYYSMYFFLLSP